MRHPRESDTWPTDTRSANGINGELLWPSVVGTGEEIGFGDNAQFLLDAPPQCQNPGGQVDRWGNPAMFRGASGYRYELSPFLGLRGTFWSSSGEFGTSIMIKKEENYLELRVYRLWQWVGVTGTALGDEQAEDVSARTKQGRFGNQAVSAGATTDNKLVGKLNLYFYDGSTVDGEGLPVMRRYYVPGQTGSSSNNRVGQGFYEIHSDRPPTPHEQRDRRARTLQANKSYDTTGISGGQGSEGLSGSGVGSREVRSRATGGHGDARFQQGQAGFGTAFAKDYYAEELAVLEADYGKEAAKTAAQTITATDLAWATLQREMRDTSTTANGYGPPSGSPLLSGYATSNIRTNMLSSTAQAMRDMPIFGGSPDIVQSRINGNLRKKLHDEGFADHWIKFFLSVENINTITVAGFMTRENDEDPKTSGFDSGVGTTGILAGLNPALTPGGNHLSPFEPEPETPPSVKIVVRAPFGYISPPSVGSGGGGGAGDSFTKPQLVQWFPRNFKYSSWTLRTLDTTKPHSERFIFDYAPNEIQYQGLGAEWVEVPRTGDLPLVEFSKWSLMRVTMQFLIANTNIDSLGMPHPDGLVTGVYDKIEKLRAMAQRPFPVSAMNIDQLLRVSMKRAEVAGRPLEFVISDFSITSQQRTIIKGSNEITAAQCSLTLQEIPIEAAFKIKFRRPIVAPVVIAPDQESLEADLNNIHPLAGVTLHSGTGYAENALLLPSSGYDPMGKDMHTMGGTT